MKPAMAQRILIACLLLLAAGWKWIFLLSKTVPFNADEAVVGLMARHILQGERPVFFYGQAYMGSLDAWLVAGGFALFGAQVWVIRLVQVLLFLGTIGTTVLIAERLTGSLTAGLLAGALLTIPTVNVTLYTTASLGGYGEALLIGNLILLAAIKVAEELRAGQNPFMWFAAWGFLAGLGLWANGLTLVYSAPSGFYLLWNLFARKQKPSGGTRIWALPVILVGFLAGAMPWWLYAIQNGPGQLVSELLGTAVAVERQPWLAQVGSHAASFLLLGSSALFGFRPPWEVRWLALPLAPLALAFWLATIAWSIRKLSRPGMDRAEWAAVAGVFGVVLAGFLFTPFGIDPSGRYFLPMTVPLVLFAAAMCVDVIKKTGWRVAIAGLVVLFQGWGTVQCARVYPPGLTTQFYAPSAIDHRYDAALIDFLRQQGETRGYSNYWVAYPLAFETDEEMIFVPALPYHPDLRFTSRDNRYPPYTDMVANSSRVAYITSRLPELDTALRTEFHRLNVDFQEQRIGDFNIFYGLSRSVRPEELRVSTNE